MRIFCTSLICFIILWSTAMAQENVTPTLSITEQLAFSTVRIEVTTKEGSGTGTGFFFNFLDDGKQRIPAIVTNKHVVSNTQASYKVIDNKGREYNVQQISRDPSNDIAILKIDSSAGSGQGLWACARRLRPDARPWRAAGASAGRQRRLRR